MTHCASRIHLVVVWTALAAAAFAGPAPGLPAQGDGRAPIVAAAPEGAEPPWPLCPWKPGVPYQFDWYMSTTSGGNAPCGKTVFKVSWNAEKSGLECTGELVFSRQGAGLKGRFFTLLAPDLRPAFYMSRFVGGDKDRSGGDAGVTAAFGPKEIVCKLGTAKSSKPQHVPVPPERFWLYGHQAIQHWAIFLTALDPANPAPMKVFMPDHLRFLTITFSPEGTEETRGTVATKLAFSTELFAGTVWLGPDRRLLRYQQRLPNGALDIWIAPVAPQAEEKR